jgi:glycosyltransferase involved in cell wall biosynthesis
VTVGSTRLGLVIGQLTAGGAEGQLLMLCRGLRGTDIAPFVYCLSRHTGPYRTQLEACGVPVRVLDGGRAARALKLRRWLENDRIDLVHAWLFIADAYAWVATARTGRPLLTSARNCKRQGHVLGVLTRFAFMASRAIVVNSRGVAAYIARNYGVPPERIRVIYNAIDTERFHPHKGAGCDAIGRIVAVGRLVEQKNHAMFLEAAARIAREVAVSFVIVGDGPLRESLERQARALGIDQRVRFAGERHDVESILRGAGLLWLTSRWEGMPNVVLEAMASGVPAIATDVGGARELIRSGVDGFVVPDQDIDAFIQRSRELLQDKTRRQQFGEAARAHAEEFSPARMVAAMLQVYAEILRVGKR